MKKLELIEFGHKTKDKKPKTQALMEEVLGKIREIESREERRETGHIKPFEKHSIKEKFEEKEVKEKFKEKETKEKFKEKEIKEKFKEKEIKEKFKEKEIKEKFKEKEIKEKFKSSKKFHYHHKRERDFSKDSKKAQEEIKNLTKLVGKKRPGLDKEKQKEIAEQLFDLGSNNEDYKIQDEIAALKILLMNQVFLIESGDPKADSDYTSKLQAEIADLASLL